MDAEERIDQMITAGKRIVEEAIAAVRPAAIVAAFSGGNDSIVSTHFATTNVIGCGVWNADTQIGLQPARKHIDACFKRFGWNGEIVKAEPEGPPPEYPYGEWTDGATAYEEFVLNFGFAGPPMHGRMYQRLKERPLASFRRKTVQRGRRLLIISGIRADESAIRAGYRRAWADSPKTGCTWVNPFYYHTAADFAAYRDEFGLPHNPVKLKCGISGECCCGAFGKPETERPAYRGLDGPFADYLDRLEARVRERFPWSWGSGPPKWWVDQMRGQQFLFPDAWEGFQPMCVGCNNGRR
jgi:3'-phosphoadenosine 5'-phosphosulfate sulfotransferase (PAPS reductase)/FAD synthetase